MVAKQREDCKKQQRYCRRPLLRCDPERGQCQESDKEPGRVVERTDPNKGGPPICGIPGECYCEDRNRHRSTPVFVPEDVREYTRRVPSYCAATANACLVVRMNSWPSAAAIEANVSSPISFCAMIWKLPSVAITVVKPSLLVK